MDYYSRPATNTSGVSPSYSQRQRGYRLCDYCGTAETPALTRFQLCGCMTSQYCSRECQKSHWPAHKPVCQYAATLFGERSLSGPRISTSAKNPTSAVDAQFGQTYSPLAPGGTIQRSITAQFALEHAIANEVNISDALASCGISGSAYSIQVGFNENMISLGKGALQEIYIHVNFEIPGDGFPVFNKLGKVLSPFPSMVMTPTTLHRIPVLSQDGKTLKETEFWVLVERRGIFRRDLSRVIPHDTAAQVGQIQEGTRHSHRVSTAQPCSDSTGGEDAGGGTGSSGNANFYSGDVPGENGGGLMGGSGPPGSSRSPGGGGLPDDGRDGDGDKPAFSLGTRDRHGGSQPGELSIPLSAVLDVEWDQDPRISQRFSTTSKVDITVHEDGDVSFPGPLFETKFSQLQVETRAVAETQYSLHFTRVQIIASRHPTTVLDSSPHTTPSAENTFKVKEGQSCARAGEISIGKNPNVKFGATIGRQSETEDVRNRSKVAVFLNAQGSPGDRVMQWDYSVDDKHEQQFGRTFEDPPPPQVKLGFDMPNKPHLEIDLLVYWSTHTKTTAQPSGISRFFSLKGKERACTPAFANLLQQVSISVPLQDLKGDCWFFGPTLEMKTIEPSPNVGLQCKATRQEAVRSKGNLVDLKVSFGCALHGEVKSRTEVADAPPPPPLLRSPSQKCYTPDWTATKQPGTLWFPDENLAKNLRRFTTAQTTLLGWAGFQALQLKRIPANVRQMALLIELNYRDHAESHCRYPYSSTYLRDPLVISDIQRREERCRMNGGIGVAIIIIQCSDISQVMPVDVDHPSKIAWDTREDWGKVLRHFVESGRTDFKPISTAPGGVYYG